MVLVTAFEFYLTVHILAAIVWVGGAMVSQVFAARALADPRPERLVAVARDIEFVGKTMFTPASALVLVFGLLLVHESGAWSYSDGWILFALVVAGASFAVGIGFLVPENGRIAAAIERHGPDSKEVRDRITRILLVSRIELLFLLLVVVDMVTKPEF
jgi:uncharacterized membrane protein